VGELSLNTLSTAYSAHRSMSSFANWREYELNLLLVKWRRLLSVVATALFSHCVSSIPGLRAEAELRLSEVQLVLHSEGAG
jgi:hypothetical protein